MRANDSNVILFLHDVRKLWCKLMPSYIVLRVCVDLKNRRGRKRKNKQKRSEERAKKKNEWTFKNNYQSLNERASISWLTLSHQTSAITRIFRQRDRERTMTKKKSKNVREFSSYVCIVSELSSTSVTLCLLGMRRKTRENKCALRCKKCHKKHWQERSCCVTKPCGEFHQRKTEHLLFSLSFTFKLKK